MTTLAELTTQLTTKDKAEVLQGLIAEMQKAVYKMSVAAKIRAEVGLTAQAEGLAKDIQINLRILEGIEAELKRVTDGQGRQGDPATGGSPTDD